MRSRFPLRPALAAALLASSLAGAQDTGTPAASTLPGFELERLEVNPGQGSLLVGSGELLPTGGWRVMLLAHYQHLPLVLSADSQRLEVVEHKASGLLSGSYAALSWLEVGAQVPVVLWQQGTDLSSQNLASPTARGLGTPLLHARLGLLSQRAEQPVDLALDVGLGVPLGSATALARDTGLRFQSRLTLGGQFGPVRPSLEVGVLVRRSVTLDAIAGAPQVGGSELHLGAALTTARREGLGAELAARATLPMSSMPSSLELLGGVRYRQRSGLEFFALGGPGLGSTTGTPNVRAMVGLAFSVEPLPRIEFLADAPPLPLRLADKAGREAVAEGASSQGRPFNTWELDTLGASEEEPPTDGVEFAKGQVPQAPPVPQAESTESQRPFQPGSRERLVLRGTVLFSHASAEMPDELPLLDRVALLLQETPDNTSVMIEGHTDTEGTYAFNRVLSLRRAQAVRRHLVSRGVPIQRLKIHGFGANWPASTNTSEEGRRLNRRVEVLVVTETPPPAASAQPVP